MNKFKTAIVKLSLVSVLSITNNGTAKADEDIGILPGTISKQFNAKMHMTKYFDLAIIKFEDISSSIYPHDSFTATVTVKNNGNQEVDFAEISVRAHINTGIGASDVPVGSSVIRDLKPSSQKTITLYNLRAPSYQGLWEMYAVVKIRKSLGVDSEQHNNQITRQIVVN